MDDNDLEADIRAAIDGTDAPAVPVVEPVIPQQAETITDEAGRVRAPDGKFAPKAAPVDDKANTGQPVLAQQPEPETAILPPHSLKAAVKAVFGTLPKDVQDEFLRIEAEAQKAKTEWSGKGEQYNRLTKVLEPVSDRLTLSGQTPETYISALVRADQMLRDNPQQALAQIAQMYGINIPGVQAAQQPYVDPTVHQLQQNVAQLTQIIQSQQTQGEQAKVSAATAELEDFRSDPKHIYFENVRPLMATLMKDGRAETLQDAYDMAVYADPQIRSLLAATPSPKAQPAKPKDISVTGAPGQTRASPSSSNAIEDDVRAAFEEATGRI